MRYSPSPLPTFQKLVEAVTYRKLIEWLTKRPEAAVAAGRERGAEGSIMKLIGSRQNGRLANLAGDLLGPLMLADSGEWGTYTCRGSSARPPAFVSPAAPTRSSATSSANACSVCPRSRRPSSRGATRGLMAEGGQPVCLPPAGRG